MIQNCCLYQLVHPRLAPQTTDSMVLYRHCGTHTHTHILNTLVYTVLNSSVHTISTSRHSADEETNLRLQQSPSNVQGTDQRSQVGVFRYCCLRSQEAECYHGNRVSLINNLKREKLTDFESVQVKMSWLQGLPLQ